MLTDSSRLYSARSPFACGRWTPKTCASLTGQWRLAVTPLPEANEGLAHR